MILVALLAGGCKIEIEVPTGGQVASNSGTYICTHDEPCVIDVVDVYFDETFSATADSGYFFRRWVKRDRGICSLSSDDCHISTIDFAGNEILLEILASDERVYLEPEFSPGTCQDTDSEWRAFDDTRETYANFSASVTACPDNNEMMQSHRAMRVWADDRPNAESQWDLGLRQGISQQWWHNGNIRSVRRWSNGVFSGLQKYYYGDGSLQSYETYKYGVRQGRYAAFNKDGSVRKEGTHPPSLVPLDEGLVEDSVQRITWTSDGNLFRSLCEEADPLALAFIPQDATDSSEICEAGGKMSWNDAQLWMDHLNAANYQGYDNWRLPSTDTDSDCYRDSNCARSEMSRLYYHILGNKWAGGGSDCFYWSWRPRSYSDDLEGAVLRNCLVNQGPFTNVQPDVYWSSTLHPDWGDMFFFSFRWGKLDSDNAENRFFVWPVRSWQ